MGWKFALSALVVAAIPVAVGTLHSKWSGVWLALLAPLFLLGVRRRGAELLASVVAVVVSIELADGVLRIVGDDLLYHDAHGRFIERRPEAEDLHRYRPAVSFSQETFGDLTAMGGNPTGTEQREIRFATDAAGFPTAPAGAPVDLILLGDSFGAALGSSQEDGIAAALEPAWVSYNLSVGGAGPREELLTLSLEIDRIPRGPHTRLLWLLFEGNDLDESENVDLEFDPDPGWTRRLGTSWQGFRKRSPIRQLLERVEAALFPDEGEPPLIREARLEDGRTLLFFRPYDHDRNLEAIRGHRRFGDFEALFARVAGRADEFGLELVVAILPTKARIYPTDASGIARVVERDAPQSGFASAVEALCDGRGLICIDLAPGLAEAARQGWQTDGSLLWWRDDTHWNGRGHAAAARILAARFGPPRS